MNMAVPAKPGWQAQLDLGYGLRGSRTRLINKRQLGPLTLQRPFYPEGDTCHSYILHPPGGVVGGDSLQINVHAASGAHCLLTTPGATKFYRSRVDQVAQQSVRISVEQGAVTEWLPQPNIFFPGANVALSTRIDVDPRGKFVGWEIQCLGRPANGEKFFPGALGSKTQVAIGGELRLAENLNVCGEQSLVAATGLRGLAMQGSLIAAPCNTEQKDLLEQILHATLEQGYSQPVGLTLVDDILVVRALGEQAEPLQRLFTRLWSELRQHWLHKPPCAPRIWAT